MTFCIQCALEALVAGTPQSEITMLALFPETPEAHMTRVHPDPIATRRRREELHELLGLRITDRIIDPTKS
jgi:hypothetical protein